jgi:hypothetical protein
MARPDWMLSDKTEDVTDAWLARFDPENETGALATAHFHEVAHDEVDAGADPRAGTTFEPRYRMVGIEVVDADGAHYHAPEVLQ